jgi:hypothetical protein
MTRLRELRIVRWELKLLYVIGVFVVGYVVAALLRAVGADDPALFTGLVTDTAGVLVGARIFRVREEPLQPPRAWWRMTGRPTLSRRLGILFTVFAAFWLIGLVGVAVGLRPSTPVEVAVSVTMVLQLGLFAWLYFNSAIRLRRAGVTTPPKFRAPAKLA